MDYKMHLILFAIISSSFCFFNHLASAAGEDSSVEKCSQKRRPLKILVYSPTVSWSHSQFLGKIADTLAGAGHEVHFLKFIMEPSLREKNETILARKVYVVEPREESAQVVDLTRLEFVQKPFTHQMPLLNFFDHQMKQFAPGLIAACQEMIENTELLNALAKEQFDVGIAEMYDLCPMAILHRIGVHTKLAAFAARLLPMISRRFGIPTFPSYTPNLSSPRGSPLKSSFLDRLLNFYNEMNDWLRADDFPTAAQAQLIRRQFGPEFPELKAIVRNVSMAFINSSPFLDMPQPISNKIVYIGGLVDEQKKQKASSSKLDQRSQQILDNAGDGGAVLFSFGSITDTTQMSVQMRRALLWAFARFPSVQFLWKLDSLSAQNDSALLASLPNVHIFEWIQQTAVLNHPNLRAFISHCGLNSVGEASRAGVPVVAIPLFADQAYNAIAIEYTGMAVRLNILELNGGANAEELIVEALNKILNEPKYGRNAKLVSRKLELTPFSPAERLIRWVEFAAEFDNLNELNLPSGDDHFGGWFFYYSLDAISFTLALLVGLVWMAWKCLKFLMMTIYPIAAKLTRKNMPKLKNK